VRALAASGIADRAPRRAPSLRANPDPRRDGGERPSRRRTGVGTACAAQLLLAAGGCGGETGGERAPGTAAPAPPDARELPASLAVDRPRDGESLRTVRPRVSGRATGHRSLYFNSMRVEIGPDGRFDTPVEIPPGQAELLVRDGDAPGDPLARLALTIDVEAPLLELDELPGAHLGQRYRRLCAAREVEVAGSASDAPPGAVDRLSLDGVPVALDGGGRFRAAIALETEGETRRPLVLADRAGNEARIELVLVRDLEPPRIAISEPPEAARRGLGATVVVAGRVEDAHPARATLDGAPLDLDAQGRFRREVELAAGRSALRLVAEDLAGNRSPELVLELER